VKYSTSLNDAFGSIGQTTGIISKKTIARKVKFNNYSVLIRNAAKDDVKDMLIVLQNHFAG